MRFRNEKHGFSDAEELKQVGDIRMLSEGEPSPAPPEEAHWSRQLVRINARIDEVSSGRAMSLSWAARVAIPGVVSILFFLIGLQYYVPRHEHDIRVASVLENSTVQNLDTVLSIAGQSPAGAVQDEIADSYMNVSNEQLSEYLIANGRTTDVMDVMSDQQVGTVLSRLGNTR
jgi:hypothetical protein